MSDLPVFEQAVVESAPGFTPRQADPDPVASAIAGGFLVSGRL